MCDTDSITLEYEGLDRIQEIAGKILKYAEDFRIWLFIGDLGAGKTTLIKTICQKLEVIDVVSSPTFSIINEYENTSGEKIYHFDFYRVKDEQEAYDIGVEEYFYSGNLCLVEWPSKILALIPENYLMIRITVQDENKRQLVITKNEEA